MIQKAKSKKYLKRYYYETKLSNMFMIELLNSVNVLTRFWDTY